MIFEERGKNLYFRVSLPKQYARYLVDKGCVSVDGCSLTVCEVEEDSFAIWLIPHTLGKTNLKQRTVGDRINLEFDILAKYVEKFSYPLVGRFALMNLAFATRAVLEELTRMRSDGVNRIYIEDETLQNLEEILRPDSPNADDAETIITDQPSEQIRPNSSNLRRRTGSFQDQGTKG